MRDSCSPKKNLIYTNFSPNMANLKDKNLHINKKNTTLANKKSPNFINSTKFINRVYSNQKNLRVDTEKNFNPPIDISQINMTENYKSEAFEDKKDIKSLPHDTAHISPGLLNKLICEKENYLKLKRENDHFNKSFSGNFDRKVHGLPKSSHHKEINYGFYPRRIPDTLELKQKIFEDDRQLESDIILLSGNLKQNGYELKNRSEAMHKIYGETNKSLPTNVYGETSKSLATHEDYPIIFSNIYKKKIFAEKYSQ